MVKGKEARNKNVPGTERAESLKCFGSPSRVGVYQMR
jgi:hypothetical protein